MHLQRVSEFTSGSVKGAASSCLMRSDNYRHEQIAVSESRLTALQRVSEFTSGSVKGAAFSCLMRSDNYHPEQIAVSESRLTALQRMSEFTSGSVKGAAFSCLVHAIFHVGVFTHGRDSLVCRADYLVGVDKLFYTVG